MGTDDRCSNTKERGGDTITEISIPMIRNTVYYKSKIHQKDLPKQMYALVKMYAEETCPKRGECQKLGMISACLRCFCDNVLEEDMIANARGKSIVSWTAKRREKK